MSTGVTARDIVSVCLLTLASGAVYFAAGVRFDASPFPSYIQFIDAELLNERLLESIWYSHAHPPGLNLLVGVAYRVFGDAAPTFLSRIFNPLLYGVTAEPGFIVQSHFGFDVPPSLEVNTSVAQIALWTLVLVFGWLHVRRAFFCAGRR